MLGTLYMMLEDAHKASTLHTDLTFDEWVDQRAKENVNFRYWIMIMDLEKLILVFIKAQRTRDFQLYVAAWLGMMKYIFVLDHNHYCSSGGRQFREL